MKDTRTPQASMEVVFHDVFITNWVTLKLSLGSSNLIGSPEQYKYFLVIGCNARNSFCKITLK